MKSYQKLIKFIILLSAVNLGSFSSLPLVCKFRFQGSYSCQAFGLENKQEDAIFSAISGTHERDKSNEDVTVLTIRNQNASFIPKDIANFFSKLQRYEVKNSSLVSVSKNNFENLTMIETLILENNVIEKLEAIVFEDLTILKNLRLSDNKLTELEHNLFSKNTKLEIISLYNNKIISLHEDQFASLLNLKEIYLQNNEIAELREQTFANNLKLTTIDMSHNRLVTIGPDVLKNLVELKKFDFYNNECIKKKYETIEELSLIFHSSCFPPYFKRYEEKIKTLEETQKSLIESLQVCGAKLDEEKLSMTEIRSELQTKSDEKESLESEKRECVDERDSCKASLDESETLKDKSLKALEKALKELGDCRLSEDKCLSKNSLFNETVAAALKKSSKCVTQLNAITDLVKLNNSTIDELETELETKRKQIKILQNEVNALTDKKKLQLQLIEPSSQSQTLNRAANENITTSVNIENCEQQSNELKEAQNKLEMTEGKLKSALAQHSFCSSFLIACSFEMISNVNKYACKAKHISACQPGMKLTSVEGTHLRSKSNINVEDLEIKDSIFHFPENIFWHLPNLRTIIVSNSGLSSLQPKLKSLRLLELEVVDNKLVEIPENIFEGLKNLGSLLLDRNGIQVLHSDSFIGLSRLQQLSMNDNFISDLPENIFNELLSLSSISLNNNRLTSLSGELFKLSPKLEYVLFNDNQDLKLIGENLLDFSRNLKMAQFRGTCVGQSLKNTIDEIKKSIKINCK